MKKSKIESLQGLRMIAFLIIFTSHISDNSIVGAGGVSIFLVMSGFLMSYNYVGDNKKWEDTRKLRGAGVLLFAVNKIKKLYPLHIILLFPALILQIYAYYLKNFTLSEMIGNLFKIFFANVLLIQSWFPDSSIYFSLNGVSWYLSVTFFCYLAFPLYLKHFGVTSDKKKNLHATISIIIFMIVTAIIVNLRAQNYIYWFTYICPVYRIADFLIGCCLGRAFINREEKYTRQVIAIFSILELIAIIVYIIADVIYVVFPGIWWKMDLLFLPCSCMLVYLFALNRGILSRIFCNKIVIWIGDISAYMYLFHQIIIKYLKAVDIYGVPLFIIAFGVTVVSSYVYIRTEKRIKLLFSYVSV